MTQFATSPDGLDDFAQWLDTPLGGYLLKQEQGFFDQAVADVFGYYAVQLDLVAHDFLQANRMPTRVQAGRAGAVHVRCDPAMLPFSSATVDLLILPHTLDFHPDPREVLREAERVLVPEGRLIITGFNPWSLWGGARIAKRRRGQPWGGHFLSLPRVKDWLALLGLQPAGGRMLCYAPPLASTTWRERFAFLEFAGDRWWPVGGAVYCLESVKRVRGMRLIAPAWKQPLRVRQPAVVASVEQVRVDPAQQDR